MSQPVAESPEFSIVVPAFNAERTIRRAIDSVQAQTSADWELIVVDDGSTDATRSLAEKIALHDPRVRVVTQPNAGTAAARNRGAREARSGLLGFFDADDMLDAEYLSTMDALVREHPEFSAYSCNAYHDYPDGTRILAYGVDETPYREISLRDEIDNSQISMHSVVRREVFEELGGFSDHYAEDYDFWLRCVAAGHRVMRVPQALVVVDATPSGKSGVREHQLGSIRDVLSDLRDQRRLDPSAAKLLDRRIIEVSAELELVPVKRQVREGDYRGARRAFIKNRRAMRYPRRLVVLALVLVSPRLYRSVAMRIDPSVV